MSELFITFKPGDSAPVTKKRGDLVYSPKGGGTRALLISVGGEGVVYALQNQTGTKKNGVCSLRFDSMTATEVKRLNGENV